jgi:predicted nucleotidyltransferase component of viral defense system
LIRKAAENSGISADIIEKDYYVTLMLQELAAKQETIKAYFKGGTCLYKIYAPMQRFSEDIDLTVYVKGISKSQAKKMLEYSSKKYISLEADEDDCANENRKGSITQIYKYDSCFEVPDDPLQRYEKVKVEATSFTISEPTEKNLIHPLLLDALPKDIAETVRREYGLQDFEIENISLERIFCDKLLAAEFYVEREEYFDVAKHIYDIVTMVDMPRIQTMINDEIAFINYLSYKRIEETLRIGSDLSKKPFDKFQLFDTVFFNEKFETAFEDMQRKYIFQDEYHVAIQNVRAIMTPLKKRLIEIDWKEQEQLASFEFKNRLEEYNSDLGDNHVCSEEKMIETTVCRKRRR